MKITVEQIDALLPQTQCRECGFDGCKPYATALAQDQSEINHCRPGGVETLQALGKLLERDPSPFIDAMQAQFKPRQLALIREEECIGCTKCIQACPVDAIIGSAKQMHTVIKKDCTGCELCIAPCPVDCIDLIPAPVLNKNEQQQEANQSRLRYQRRQLRLERLQRLAAAKLTERTESMATKKDYIKAAIERVKLARQKKTL